LEDRLSLPRQARGIWKDWTDPPAPTDLRREWDRQTEPDNRDTKAVREKLAAEFNFDVKTIFADLRKRQAAL